MELLGVFNASRKIYIIKILHRNLSVYIPDGFSGNVIAYFDDVKEAILLHFPRSIFY
jgi:hypothetical protein